VPTMVHFLLAAEVDRYSHGEEETNRADDNLFWRAHHAFNRQFHRLRDGYRELLISAIDHPRTVAAFFVLLCGISGALLPFLGRDFFPQVDAGQIRLHVRAPAGTRIEQTEVDFAKVENTIRSVISRHDLDDILDNIGLPYAGNNLAYSDSGTVGSFDGEVLISLKPGEHHPTWDYVRQLRKKLTRDYPEMTFFFQPADIVGQTLNFGLPAPIDIQVIGPLTNEHPNYRMAQEIESKVKRIAGTADVHIHQVMDVPEMRFDVDRVRADQMGMTQKDVANSMLVSMGSSRDIAPNYWINPQNGVDYPVVVQTPTMQLDSTATMLSTPIRATGTQAPQLLANIAGLTRGSAAAIVNHYNVQPVFDIYANVQDRDLGGVAGDVGKLLNNLRPKLPKGSFFEMRGQVETMRTSFIGLGVGLVFAIMLVYFLMVVNFQSWLDPFIILMALPGALAGILVMLFLTQTTLNVPSLMGAIMSIGVATANSILLVTFANDLRLLGEDARTAAIQAGFTRLRPVIMTALAMIVGMLPMAVGLGEGGEQNAPLGRAVIGGLLMATVATLFFVPVVYSVLRKKAPSQAAEDAVSLEEERI
jgi:multidrug efflux pump subunit AcrB